MERITDGQLLGAIRTGLVVIVRNIANRDATYQERFDMITREAARRGLIGWGQ